MQVRVTANGAHVVDAELLNALAVVTELEPDHTVRVLVQDGLVRPRGETSTEHVWLDIEELGRRAEPPGNPAWRSGYDAMIAYVADKGWTDPDRTVVRAHVEASA